MDLNDTHKKALYVSKTLKSIFAERVSNTQIYDVVHEKNHYAFKLKFIAYNYFVVVFQYELDIIGCSVLYGDGSYIPLSSERHCLSDENLSEYFNEIKKNLELRIPDKYLLANGWLN